jgi:hypothetical protein
MRRPPFLCILSHSLILSIQSNSLLILLYAFLCKVVHIWFGFTWVLSHCWAIWNDNLLLCFMERQSCASFWVCFSDEYICCSGHVLCRVSLCVHNITKCIYICLIVYVYIFIFYLQAKANSHKKAEAKAHHWREWALFIAGIEVCAPLGVEIMHNDGLYQFFHLWLEAFWIMVDSL